MQTDYTLKAKTQGFNEASAATEKLGRKTAASTQAAREEVHRLEQQLRRLAREQTDLNRALDQTKKGSSAYQDLSKALDGVEKKTGRVERNIRALERAYRDADREASKGAFLQGLLQGAVPEASFIQRGPGAMRQAAGMAMGRMGRGVAGGVSQIPFQGAAGIAQALQSVPGGGFLAQPLMQSMQRAQQALQYRQMRQELQPFLSMSYKTGGSVSYGETPEQQRARIAAQYDRDLKKSGPIQTVPAPVSGLVSGDRPLTGEISKGLMDAVFPQLANRKAATRAARNTMELERLGGPEEFTAEKRRQAREAAIQRQIEVEGVSSQKSREATLQDAIRRQGRRFGYALPEAAQAAGAVTQVGGGSGRELVDQGMLPMLMAGKRMGLGADVAGAFLQGGRRGGVVGGLGRAGGSMEDAIKQGMALGLEGSELNDWLQQMAGDIRGWKSSGIPINTGSVAAIGQSLAISGAGGLRGGMMARGIASRARDLSKRGPQSAAEFVMMQELGGWTGQGGADEVLAAQKKLETQDYKPEDVQRMIKRMTIGTGSSGVLTMRRAMESLGIQMSATEAEDIATGKISPEKQKMLISERMRGGKAAEAFSPELIAGRTDKAIQRQAGITNQQISSGMAMVKAMQDLESTTSNVITGFTTLAAGPLTNLTNSISGLSDEIPELTRRLRQLVGMEGMLSRAD